MLDNSAAITLGPIEGSHKIHQPVPGTSLTFPARRIELTNGEHLDVYDTPESEPMWVDCRVSSLT